MSNKESKTSVVLSEQVFKDYMFANYMSQLPHKKLLEILQEQVSREFLVDLAKNLWELPFDLCDEQIVLCDADELLVQHTESYDPEYEDCPDLWPEQPEDWPIELSFDESNEPGEEDDWPDEPEEGLFNSD